MLQNLTQKAIEFRNNVVELREQKPALYYGSALLLGIAGSMLAISGLNHTYHAIQNNIMSNIDLAQITH